MDRKLHLGCGALRFIFSPLADSRFGFVLGDDFSSANLANSQYCARITTAGKTAFGTASLPHSRTRAESSSVEVDLPILNQKQGSSATD